VQSNLLAGRNDSQGTQGKAVHTQRVRRDATKIIYEILFLGLDGVSKTQIIYRANLSHQLAESYILFLVKKGLLETGTDPQGFTRYWITQRGERLLRLLRDVEKELGDFFLRPPSLSIGVQGPV
jgi:predicted transcriptional regulator